MTDFLVGVFLWFMVRAAILTAVAWLLWLVVREWTAPWRRQRTRRRLIRKATGVYDEITDSQFEPLTMEAMEARGMLKPEEQWWQEMEEER